MGLRGVKVLVADLAVLVADFRDVVFAGVAVLVADLAVLVADLLEVVLAGVRVVKEPVWPLMGFVEQSLMVRGTIVWVMMIVVVVVVVLRGAMDRRVEVKVGVILVVATGWGVVSEKNQ